MERLSLITLKNLIGSIPGDKKEVRKLSNVELAVILSDREYLKGDYPKRISEMLAPWKPKVLGNGVKVEGFRIVLKKRAHQRKPKKRYDGLKNEAAFHEYLLDALRECTDGCSLNVYFTIKGVTVFSVEGVKKVERTGQKEQFQRKKADEKIILTNGTIVPLSIKQENAGSWESGDGIHRVLAETFWTWGVKNKYIVHRDHPQGLTKTVSGVTHKIQRIDRDIAFKLKHDLAKMAIFGSDIIPNGAVIVADFSYDSFTQEGENLFVECKHVFRKMEDIPTEYYPHFLFRNGVDRIVNKGAVIPAGIRPEIVTKGTGGKIGNTGRVLIVDYAH